MTLKSQTGNFTFTGRHMLLTMIAFFGTIITVNVTMAYFARSSWSGLVVDNTYVASQQFNGKTLAIRKMLATGIRGDLTATDVAIRYRLTMPGGQPVVVDQVTAHFKRPVGESQDFETVLTPAGDGYYVAEHAVLPGHWIVELKALRAGELVMHEARRIAVIGGAR